MPRIYLSPSVQEYNLFAGGGTEEEYANAIADAMEPYLYASEIDFTRNNPDMSLSQVIAASNAGNYDFHLAIHSNAGPEALSGLLMGPDVYYYLTSDNGKRMANLIVANMESIYPNPALVDAVPTFTLAELRRTDAPAALVEVAYHDNLEDAQWIRDNIDNIARELTRSVAQYFNIPFVEPVAS